MRCGEYHSCLCLCSQRVLVILAPPLKTARIPPVRVMMISLRVHYAGSRFGGTQNCFSEYVYIPEDNYIMSFVTYAFIRSLDTCTCTYITRQIVRAEVTSCFLSLHSWNIIQDQAARKRVTITNSLT